jgi:hypothetical protein
LRFAIAASRSIRTAGRRQVRDGGDGQRGFSLGGEQSGHVIFSDHLFTGDGLATALNVLRIMADTGEELSELASQLVTYPQVLVNVRVRQKTDLSRCRNADSMRKVEEHLSGHGRLLVRYSGTEPLLRIMLEGKDEGSIRAWADEIASAGARESSVIKLSVNVNKVATVRNSRGGSIPSGDRSRSARASTPARPGFTVHPRADRAPHHDGGRARDRRRAGAAQGPRRVQHRRRSAAGFSRPRARGQTRSVHARAGEARRDYERSRLAR